MVTLFAAAMLPACSDQGDDAAYVIRRVGPDMKIDGNINKPQWQLAQAIHIKENPFDEKGRQSPTTAKAVYNHQALFLLFVSQDEHIVARNTVPNSQVSDDDCVEFFASPWPDKSTDYFNLEINCVGTVLLRFGPECQTWKEARAKRKADPQLIERLEIYHSVPGPTKEATPADKEWIIECKVPFTMLKDFAGLESPQSGTVWRANFYRCGAKVGEIPASWQKLDKKGLGFHQPRYFGPVRFE